MSILYIELGCDSRFFFNQNLTFYETIKVEE